MDKVLYALFAANLVYGGLTFLVGHHAHNLDQMLQGLFSLGLSILLKIDLHNA